MHALLRPALALAPLLALAWPRPAAPHPLQLAASRFLDALDAERTHKALFAFDDAERTHWAFVPSLYPGVLLADLDLPQRRLAHALLREALSEAGYQKTVWIMRMEEVLRARESTPDKPATHRDPERYAIALFGDPRKDTRFGLRFQGHHVSWNLTLVDGALVSCLPRFLGSNPAEMREGPFAGTRVLGAEEDAARALLASLSDAQRKTALLPGDCPADILLGPGRAADLLGTPRGIAFADLEPAQRGLLWDVVEGFATDLRSDGATRELERIRATGKDGICFAWIGALEPGKAHYWRIHGPGFAIESCNIQDGANHVHTVWNDLRNGFGADALREHVASERR
ncbi:MAG: DUF3500 domain-containing protein [Planctomycetota bacterium]